VISTISASLATVTRGRQGLRINVVGRQLLAAHVEFDAGLLELGEHREIRIVDAEFRLVVLLVQDALDRRTMDHHRELRVLERDGRWRRAHSARIPPC